MFGLEKNNSPYDCIASGSGCKRNWNGRRGGPWNDARKRRAMSEDRLERALEEMREEDRRRRDARGRPRARLG